MYTQYFGLTEAPFSIAPNPQFLYMSPRHQEALAHLLYGIQSDGGFILLTGEVGTGKTTLCRCLLQQIPQDVEIAFVLNPRVTAKQLLASICDEFGVPYSQSASLKRLVDSLNAYLLECHAGGKRAVLIIDEAQNLSRDLLEQLRLLTNLETSERKLMQIILLGQPELLDMLAKKDLRQFSQRITARFHLEGLNQAETIAYIQHRLQLVGGDEDLFTRVAMKRVYRLSGGIPRVINLICDRSLLGAYAQAQHRISGATVDRAAVEVLGGPSRAERIQQWSGLCAAAIVLVATGLWLAGFPLVQMENRSGVADAAPAESARSVVVEPTIEPTVSGHLRLEDAYHDLFALWGVAFNERNRPGCELAANVGLQCFELVADLQEISEINRPAVVSINDQYLTISGVTASGVVLIAGSSQFEITREAFANLHQGTVRLMWRTPPAYTAPLKISDTGEAVQQLVTRLARIQGESPPDAGSTYTENVETQVRSFQASVGLNPSGIADPLTWIHINNMDGSPVPTLQGKG